MLVFALTVALFAPIFAGTVLGMGSNSYAQNIESELGIELVSSAEGHAVVITSVYADTRTADAAQSLTNYVYQSTGVTFPIMTEASYATDPNLADKTRIYVGQRAQAAIRMRRPRLMYWTTMDLLSCLTIIPLQY
ncbi:MAG: hypothetical protein K0R67_1634 [Paenibacillus sp.]|nr:hypothetical protein [Paenibacillus sp.]